MIAPIDFEFRFGKSQAARRRSSDEAPLRILMMADLSGRRNRTGGDTVMPPASTTSVDIDTFEAVFTKLSPALRFTLGEEAVALTFSSLEDFHPDRLLRQLAPVIAKAARSAPAAAPTAPVAPTPKAAGTESADDTVARLLGRRPEAPAPDAGIDAFIKSVVAPHIVPAAAPGEAPDRTAETEILRAVLHHPEFQRLEAAWRGVYWLVSRLAFEPGRLELHLLDVCRDEIVNDIAQAGESLEQAGLFRRLVSREPWSLVVSELAFGPEPADITLLADLGAIAAHAGGPLLAGASPALLGLHTFQDTPDPRDWPDAYAAWSALRASAVAPWIGLAAPRLLLRQPYGRRSDPIESFDFEELGNARQHDHYLWGSGALGAALLIAESFDEDGWAMTPGDRLDIDDLPVHTFQEGGESRMQPCAEALLGERGYTALLEAGVMPLMSAKHRGAVRLLRLQSVASPPAALNGPWTD